jgi:ATP adenylyltransferase
MRYLWAPWRMDYISNGKQKGCIFCEKPKEKKDKKNLILYRGKYACVMMNKFPYNNGHLMVFPKRHCPDLEDLEVREFQELFVLLKTSTRVLKDRLHPQGFNIGMNIGKVGGAGFDEHIHFHIVPRWTGDTNFMPVIGETKTVPEYLEKTYQKLYSAFRFFLESRKGRKGGQQK